MKCFVVNLKQSVHRRFHIQQQADAINLPIELIDAIDGKSLTNEELARYVDCFEESALTKGEIGCALSHLSIYEKMVAENIPLALILEDDVVLSPALPQILAELECLNPADVPTVCLLNSVGRYIDRDKFLSNGKYKIVPTLDSLSAYSYVINLKAAQNLLTFSLPIKWEADQWQVFKNLKLISLKNIVPPPVHIAENGQQFCSTLETERALRHNKRKAVRKKLMAQFPLSIKIQCALWKGFIKPFLPVVKN